MAKQRTPAKPAEVIDVVPDNPETRLAKTEGDQVGSFLGGLATFLTGASQLETQAKERLVEAKALRAPVNGDEDEQIKAFVRMVRAERKQREEYFQIKLIIHRFHARLSAAFKRTDEPLEAAERIANQLHASYVDAERRRAADEERRLRLEEEERQRKAREVELAELEAKAVAAEEGSPDLSEREQRYLDVWFRNGGDAQRAAKEVGYRDPIVAAARLTTSEKIREAIARREEADTLRRQAQAKREMPVEVEHIEVRPDVAAGKDRESWSAELLDEAAFIEAVISGRYGIPRDVLTVRMPALNEHARKMQTLIDRWPGVRAKRTTSVR